MRPVQIGLNGLPTSGLLGASPWVPIDYLQMAFGVGLGVTVSPVGATLNVSVQHTFDELGPQALRAATLTQTTTVITVTDTGPTALQGFGNGLGSHGLAVGDYVKIEGSGFANVDGEYTIATIVSSTQYTLTSAVSQSISSLLFAQVKTARVFAHTSLVNLTARANGSYGFPISAVRLLMNSYSNGTAVLSILQGAGP